MTKAGSQWLLTAGRAGLCQPCSAADIALGCRSPGRRPGNTMPLAQTPRSSTFCSLAHGVHGWGEAGLAADSRHVKPARTAGRRGGSRRGLRGPDPRFCPSSQRRRNYCWWGEKANTLPMPERCGCWPSAAACGIVAAAQAAGKAAEG